MCDNQAAEVVKPAQFGHIPRVPFGWIRGPVCGARKISDRAVFSSLPAGYDCKASRKARVNTHKSSWKDNCDESVCRRSRTSGELLQSYKLFLNGCPEPDESNRQDCTASPGLAAVVVDCIRAGSFRGGTQAAGRLASERPAVAALGTLGRTVAGTDPRPDRGPGQCRLLCPPKGRIRSGQDRF